MEQAFDKSYYPNYQEFNAEYNIQQNILQLNDYSNNYLYKSPFDISSEDIPENPFEDLFEQKFDSNAPKNEKNISSSNETDKKLSQKKTSDKSNNNPIGISNDKDIKLDLNESNEKNNSGSINPKAINIIYPNTQKGPFNIIKKKKLGRKRRINGQKGKHNKYCYDNITRKLKGLLINNYILNFVNTIIKEGEKSKSIKKKRKK